MLTSKTWRRHKTNIIFGVMVLGSLAISAPDINRNLQAISNTKQAIAANSEKQMLLDQQFEFEQQQAKIADSRYETGCIPIVAGSYPNIKYVTIVEGQTLRDRMTGRELPAGTVVCDGNGNTGVIGGDGTVGKIAFTGDRDKVQLRLRRFRGGVYSQPVDKGE